VEAILKIAAAVKLVNRNQRECVRLVRRCVAVMLSVRREVAQSGDQVNEELRTPIVDLIEAFGSVYRALTEHTRRTMFRQWLTRQDTTEDLRLCDRLLGNALSMFSLAVQIRTMKQVIRMGAQQRNVDNIGTSARQSTLAPEGNASRPSCSRPALAQTNQLAVEDTLFAVTRTTSYGSTVGTLLSVGTADAESFEPSPSQQEYLSLGPEDVSDTHEITRDAVDPRMRESGMLTRSDVFSLRSQSTDKTSPEYPKSLKHVRLKRTVERRHGAGENAGDPRSNPTTPVVAVVAGDAAAGKVQTQRAKREQKPRVRAPTSMYPSSSTDTWATQYSLDLPSVNVAHRAFMEMGIDVVYSQTAVPMRPQRPPLRPRPKSMLSYTGSKATVTSAISPVIVDPGIFTEQFTRVASQCLLALLHGAGGQTRSLLAGWSLRN